MAERIQVLFDADASKVDDVLKRIQDGLRSSVGDFTSYAQTVADQLAGAGEAMRALGEATRSTTASLTRDMSDAASAAEKSNRRIADSADRSSDAVRRHGMAWSALTGVVTHWAVRASEALVGGFTGLIENSKKFETYIADVGTLINKNVTDLSALRAEMRTVSVDVGKSGENIAKGVYDAISAGVKFEDALKFTSVAAKAAVAGISDTNVAVRALAVVQNAYGASAGSAEQVADKLFKTVAIGVIRFPQLAAGIGKVATTASLAGLNLNELLAGITELTKGGLSANMSMTGMSSLVNAIAHQTPKAAEAAKEFGIEINQTRLKNEGLVPILVELGAKLGDNFDAWRRILPQQNAARAAMILAKDAASGLSKSIGEMSNSAGALGEAFDIQSKTVEVAFQRLRSAVQAKFDELWEAASPSIIRLLDRMRQGISDISTKDLQNLIKALERVAEVLGKIIDVAIRAARTIGKMTDEVKEILGIDAIRKGLENAAFGAPGRADALRAIVEKGTTYPMSTPAGGMSIPEEAGQSTRSGPAVSFETPSQRAARMAIQGVESESDAEKELKDAARAAKKEESEFWKNANAEIRQQQAEAKRIATAMLEALKGGALRGPEASTDRLEDFIKREQEALRKEQERQGREEIAVDVARRKDEFTRQMSVIQERERQRNETTQMAARYGGAFVEGGFSAVAGAAASAGIGGLIQSGAQNIGAGNTFTGLVQIAGARFANLVMSAGTFLVDKLGELIGFAASTKPGEFSGALSGKLGEARNLVTNLRDNLPTLFAMLVPFIRDIGPIIAQSMPVIAQAFANGMPGIVSALVDQLPILVHGLVASIGPLIQAVLKSMPILVQGLISALVPGIPQIALTFAVEFVKGMFGTDFIPKLASGIGQGVFDAIKGLFDLFGKAPQGATEENVRNGTYRPSTGHGLFSGFALGGIVPQMQAFSFGGMVRDIQRTHGRDAVPVVAHAGEPILTRGTWKQIEGALVDAVHHGTGGAPDVHLHFSGGGQYDRMFEQMIERAAVTVARKQGSTVRTMREVADGADAPFNYPGVVRLVNS